MLDLNKFNSFHDSQLLSINISYSDSVDFQSDSFPSTTVNLVFRINSLKNDPIVGVTLIKCDEYKISNDINNTIHEIVFETNNSVTLITFNNCYFKCDKAVIQ